VSANLAALTVQGDSGVKFAFNNNFGLITVF
jgi:hypothetical protein